MDGNLCLCGIWETEMCISWCPKNPFLNYMSKGVRCQNNTQDMLGPVFSSVYRVPNRVCNFSYKCLCFLGFMRSANFGCVVHPKDQIKNFMLEVFPPISPYMGHQYLLILYYALDGCMTINPKFVNQDEATIQQMGRPNKFNQPEQTCLFKFNQRPRVDGPG